MNLKKIGAKVAKHGAKFVGVVGALSIGALSNSASAALDIAAATTSALTDIGAAGALIIGVMVAVAAVAWVRRVVH